ncbi:unnamed protein product [Penicillium crustosum]
MTNIDSNNEETLRSRSSASPDLLSRDSSLSGRLVNVQDRKFGQLIVDGDTSRYVNHEALVSFQKEIKTSRCRQSASPNEPELNENPNTFLFGFRSVAYNLHDLHPSPVTSLALWDVYERNVAPLVLILHRPSIRKLIGKAATNADFLDPSSEALVFAVYFAAVTSMEPEECRDQLGEDHQSVLQHYRFATEQALARADFLHVKQLTIVQAAVLFLIARWRSGDVRFVWAMTAVVLRLAQGLGLHRDGTKLGIEPFDTEMRRRLWWHIYLLDIQTSEHQATTPQIFEGTYDTELPLNTDDSDLSPESEEPFMGRTGFTETTFFLIRCEFNMRYRQLMHGSSPKLSSNQLTIEDTTTALYELNTFIENQWLRFCDRTIPIQWVAATVTRVALARLWLTAHLSLQRTGELSTKVWQQRREVLFQTAIEILGFAHLLESSEETRQWSWMFQMYRQWHAFAFILSELCVRPPSALADRAWTIAILTYQWWQRDGPPKGWVLWEPLSHLIQRVATTRDNQQHTSQIEVSEDQIQETHFSFPADSLRIASIWTSQDLEPSTTETWLNQEAGPSSMDIYRETIVDTSLHRGDD